MPDVPDADALLRRHAGAVEDYLRGPLRDLCDLKNAPPALVEAVDYSLLAGGKRLRPALVLESCHACGGDVGNALPAAAAVELVHTFSLVHDDLPAMDDDDLRRGRPTSHKRFGEATAILAGDAMTAMAFEVAATCGPIVVSILARATGPAGMVGGQVLDIAAENKRLGLDALRDVHRRKTGALLAASCEVGAVVAGGDRKALGRFGERLGLAFQIADDLLDVTATAHDAGKATNKDAAAGKSTYPALLGVDAARRLARDEAAAAVAALSDFGPAADGLRALAAFAADRGR